MKNKIAVIGLTSILLSSSLVMLSRKDIVFAKAMDIPTGCNYVTKLPDVVDLNDCSESEIRNYYSSLNEKTEDELKGNNLLKNLKSILINMNYYSYDNAWKIYEITDRDWSLSPATGDSYNGTTYDAANKKYTKYSYGESASKSGNNPYVHTLYRDDSEVGRIRAWDNHGKQNNGTDREHVWCQSRGFKANSGATGPAGTDVHHLKSGDSNVNQAIHNNNPYGYVETVSATGKHSFNNLNKNGSPKHPHEQDEATLVFEPQDSDKGDIARAIFYMAARYNNFANEATLTPANFEANLILVNYATSNGEREDSSPTHAVGMGILQDLLEWNKLDPVDEFEIHRNNLIYRNYQGNRNPFIDFPEWADYIWGTSTNGTYDPTVTGFAKPQQDKINGSSEPIIPTSETTPTTSESSQEGGNPLQKLPTWVIIAAAVAVVVIIVVIIIVLANSKKARKAAKKIVKKEIKKQAKSQAKKSTSKKK